MFSEWLDLPAPQYQLSSLKSTFLVGNRPVNVCKKLDVSVCEDIRLQLRSVAYGVEMNEWWQDIKVCCGCVLQLKDNVRLQKYCSNCRLLLSLHLFMHSQRLTHLQIWFKQNDSTFYWHIGYSNNCMFLCTKTLNAAKHETFSSFYFINMHMSRR